MKTGRLYVGVFSDFSLYIFSGEHDATFTKTPKNGTERGKYSYNEEHISSGHMT